MSIQNFLVRAIALGAAMSSLIGGEMHIDVSSIIDRAAAEAILGGRVNDSTPRNVDGTDGYYSKCNYYSATPGKSLILRVYQAAPGFNAKQELDQVRASSGLTKSLSGLGDQAELSSGAASALSSNATMLSVVKGDTLITIGLRGLEEDLAVEKIKDVAQKILQHL